MEAIRAPYAFDGSQFRSGGATVLVEDGSIVAVLPYATEVPDGTITLDHPGATVLPDGSDLGALRHPVRVVLAGRTVSSPTLGP